MNLLLDRRRNGQGIERLKLGIQIRHEFTELLGGLTQGIGVALLRRKHGAEDRRPDPVMPHVHDRHRPHCRNLNLAQLHDGSPQKRLSLEGHNAHKENAQQSEHEEKVDLGLQFPSTDSIHNF